MADGSDGNNNLNQNQNGWNQYSKLVLKELQTLSDGIDNLTSEMVDIKKDIVQIRTKEDKIASLEKWKDKVDDVATPAQLKELSSQVEDYKRFKTMATTIFAVVQFLMAAIMFAMKFISWFKIDF